MPYLAIRTWIENQIGVAPSSCRLQGNGKREVIAIFTIIILGVGLTYSRNKLCNEN